MKSVSGGIGAGVFALALLGLSAATPASAEDRDCFYVSQWQGGWTNPDPRTLLIRVNINDVYRLGLSADAPAMLNVPGYHLVFKDHGDSGPICGPADLNDLSVSDGHGDHTPLFVSSVTKLSPAEVAALPPRDRP